MRARLVLALRGLAFHSTKCNAPLNDSRQLTASFAVLSSLQQNITNVQAPYCGSFGLSRAQFYSSPTPNCLSPWDPTSSNLSAPSNEHEFVGAYTPVTKRLWQERLRMAKQRQHEASADGATVDAASVKRPPQVTAVEYRFTTDNLLLEMYRNPWGFLRMGRLLEDLDSLAGSIAFQHCWLPGIPAPHLVTVAVDAIEYSHPVTLNKDMKCQGQVVYTGGSSLDIRMELLQEPHAPTPSLVALFSFVSLNPSTKKPCKVPALQPVTPLEQQWAAERAAVAAARKAARQAPQGDPRQSLLPVQQQYVQDAIAASQLLLDMPALADPLVITAEDTSLSNAFVCQPQQRNMYGRVFGGFLMRRAFELAFSTTYLFAGARPALVRVDDITFKNPVDVGSLLRLKSHVVDVSYLSQGEAHVAVEVEAVVTQPEQKKTTHTNRFRYVFGVSLPPGGRLRRVLPTSPRDVERLVRFLLDE